MSFFISAYPSLPPPPSLSLSDYLSIYFSSCFSIYHFLYADFLLFKYIYPSVIYLLICQPDTYNSRTLSMINSRQIIIHLFIFNNNDSLLCMLLMLFHLYWLFASLFIRLPIFIYLLIQSSIDITIHICLSSFLYLCLSIRLHISIY